MTYNLFPATAAEMCCLSSAYWYVIRSRCPIRKGCDITTKVVSLLAPGKRNLLGLHFFRGLAILKNLLFVEFYFTLTWHVQYVYWLHTHTHTTKKQKPTHLLSVSSFFV